VTKTHCGYHNVIIVWCVRGLSPYSVSQLCATEAFYTRTHTYIIHNMYMGFFLSFVGDTRARRSEYAPSQEKREFSVLYYYRSHYYYYYYFHFFFLTYTLRQQVYDADSQTTRCTVGLIWIMHTGDLVKE